MRLPVASWLYGEMPSLRRFTTTLSTSILLAASSLAGCAITLAGSKADFEYQKPLLAKTASFDLGCPAEQLVYTPLGNRSDGYEKVGVSGCDKKATYIYLEETQQGRIWVKNSETAGNNK